MPWDRETLIPLACLSGSQDVPNVYTLLSPLESYLIRILRFFLVFTFARPWEPAWLSTSSGGDLPSGGEEPGWIRLLGKIHGWGSMGVFSLLGLVILLFLSKLLIQALFQSRGEGLPFSLALRHLFHRILTVFQQLQTRWRTSRSVKPEEDPTSIDPTLRIFYREINRSLKSLYRIGRLLGVKRLPSETPRHYVSRLGACIPQRKKPAEGIQLVVEQLMYGPLPDPDLSKKGTFSISALRADRKAFWLHVPVYLPAYWRN